MTALPLWLPAHSVWTAEQENVARWVRWCVINGRWTDGETPDEMASEGKLTHSMLRSQGPIPWTHSFARAFEAKPLRRSQGDSPFDPAQSGSA